MTSVAPDLTHYRTRTENLILISNAICLNSAKLSTAENKGMFLLEILFLAEEIVCETAENWP